MLTVQLQKYLADNGWVSKVLYNEVNENTPIYVPMKK